MGKDILDKTLTTQEPKVKIDNEDSIRLRSFYIPRENNEEKEEATYKIYI
jgi:hypothetical protein